MLRGKSGTIAHRRDRLGTALPDDAGVLALHLQPAMGRIPGGHNPQNGASQLDFDSDPEHGRMWEEDRQQQEQVVGNASAAPLTFRGGKLLPLGVVLVGQLPP